MKKLKKLAAVLLSLAMTAMLAIPALAAGEYSITIQNDKAGHTYEAYQIFAGDVSSDEAQEGNAEGPILSNITWGSGVDANQLEELLAALKADETIGAKFAGIENAGDAAAVADALDDAPAAEAAAFAEIAAGFLAAAPTGQTNTHVNNTHYIINALPAGYYLVKDQDGSLEGDADSATEYIVQVLGNVTMDPKDSDIPTVEKKVAEERKYQQDGGYGTFYNDVADWNIGDRVPFKLIGSIPDMSDYDTYTYVFHDTLSAGLTLDMNSFDVYVAHEKNEDPVALGWAEIPADEYTLTQTADGFTLAIDDLKVFPYVNEPDRDYILVFYDAILNENAEIGLDGNPNNVSLEFSNDPNGEGTGRTAEDTAIVFTYELDGTKVDGENVDTKLEEAQFVLLNGGKTEAAMVVNGKMTGWVKVYSEAEGENLQMPATYEEWVERYGENNVILSSDENGAFNISGLDDGTYYLREIKAPAGYNLLEEDVKVVISAATANGQTWNSTAADAFTALTISANDAEAVDGNLDTGIVNVTVANNQGPTLPETGGIGTTIFFVLGGVLVVGAGILLIVRLRMRAENKE